MRRMGVRKPSASIFGAGDACTDQLDLLMTHIPENTGVTTYDSDGPYPL